MSKETAVLINNWFILYFLSVVLIGTIYPIFLDVILDEQISVGPPFYNKLILPFLIPFVLFMSMDIPRLDRFSFRTSMDFEYKSCDATAIYTTF